MSKRSTKKASKDADPIIRALRNEQVRQGMSDYRLGMELGISPSYLHKLWKGDYSPKVETVRKIHDVLKRGNPELSVTL